MQKIHRTEAPQEKSFDSSTPPRAKPIPRHLVRTVYQVAIAVPGRRTDLSILITMQAYKLEPRRFFALLVVVLGER